MAGASGTRTIPAGDFFVDMMTTSIEDGEILSQIRIPVPPANSGSAYAKIHQSASGFAIAGVAAQVTLDGAGQISAAGVAVTGVAPIAYRASAVENALVGKTPDEATSPPLPLSQPTGRPTSTKITTHPEITGSTSPRCWTGRALASAADRAKASSGAWGQGAGGRGAKERSEGRVSSEVGILQLEIWLGLDAMDPGPTSFFPFRWQVFMK